MPPSKAPRPPPPPAITSPTTPAFATPDDKLLEEAEILRRKNMELERQMERLTTPPRGGTAVRPPFNSPSPMTMDRNPVSTPIQSYYVSAAKSKNQSALHFAVQQVDEDAVRAMLEEDIPASIASSSPLDVNSTNSDFRSPLHLAAINASPAIVEMLLEFNAVPNVQDMNGNTPLHLTTEVATAKLLLQRGGANPNIPNTNGFSALHMAAKRGDKAIAEELLKHGADSNAVCDKNWRSPVYDVAIHGNLDFLKLLIDHQGDGLELNLKDRFGYTPLHHVASLSNNSGISLASALLGASADPNVQDKHGFTPLHLLCNSKAARKKGGVGYELLKLMLEQGADPGLQARDGCTPIHLALYHKDHEAALLLMQHGSSLTLPWRFPRRSESLKMWWLREGEQERRMVLPLDIIGDDQRLLHQMLSAITRPQRWVEDGDRNACMQCKVIFTWSSRHHHCRQCGRLVCARCSMGQLSSGYFPPLIQSDLLSRTAADDIGAIGKGHRVCYCCEEILETRQKLMSPARRARDEGGGSSSSIEEEEDEMTRGSFVGMRKSLATRFQSFVGRGSISEKEGEDRDGLLNNYQTNYRDESEEGDGAGTYIITGGMQGGNQGGEQRTSL